MYFTNIASKASFPVKDGAGFVQGFTIVSQGTAWTLQLFDSARGGTSNPIVGATAMVLTGIAIGTFVPINTHFSNGLQAVSAGTTAGELVLTWS